MSSRPIEERIEDFLSAGPWAVAGASTNREKYGNKILRCYLQSGREAWPLNPRAEIIEGRKCYASLADLPAVPRGLSIITPPKITEQIVDQAIRLGVGHLWMQPGAESPAAVSTAEKAGLNVIADGSCLLVVLGYREEEAPA